jgi:hypothetical protein
MADLYASIPSPREPEILATGSPNDIDINGRLRDGMGPEGVKSGLIHFKL